MCIKPLVITFHIMCINLEWPVSSALSDLLKLHEKTHSPLSDFIFFNFASVHAPNDSVPRHFYWRSHTILQKGQKKITRFTYYRLQEEHCGPVCAFLDLIQANDSCHPRTGTVLMAECLDTNKGKIIQLPHLPTGKMQQMKCMCLGLNTL